MELQAEKVQGVTLITLPPGHLDAGNSEDFKRSVAPWLEGADKVLIDLSGLRFVDSSGLGALLSCLRRLNAAGGDLKVCGLQKQVRLLFEMVRMHRIVEIHNDRAEALTAFQG